MRGMKICPSCVSEVWTISSRGSSPSWIACADQRKGAGDHRLAGDHGRRGRQQNQRQQAPGRGEQVERVRNRFGVGDDQRALAEIVADQRRQHHEQPGILDRPAAEMAHVGVKRLRAGHGQKDAAEHHETHRAVRPEELDPRQRAQTFEDDPGVRDLQKPEHGVDGEKHQHDRAEERRHPRRAAALDEEQQNQNDDRRRQNIRREVGVDLLQPLQRRQNRDRRRDDRVAGEQRRAGDAEQEHDRGAFADRGLRQRVERENAALALVVGAHQEQHIFGGDDDQQRPDDERDGADHLTLADIGVLELAERRLQRIERAGADVAEHDAERAQRQNPELAGAVPRVIVMVERVRGGNGPGEIMRHGQEPGRRGRGRTGAL